MGTVEKIQCKLLKFWKKIREILEKFLVNFENLWEHLGKSWIKFVEILQKTYWNICHPSAVHDKSNSKFGYIKKQRVARRSHFS